MKPNILNIGDKDFIKYCITCLGKNGDMFNLNNNKDKKKLLEVTFNIKFTRYAYCPQFLCRTCDAQLKEMTNFQNQVKECLTILEEYNRCKIEIDVIDNTVDDELLHKNVEMVKLEPKNTLSSQVLIKKAGLEPKEYDKDMETLKLKSEKMSQLEGTIEGVDAKTTFVPLSAVEETVKDFKNRIFENATCVICGFVGTNRRSISSHMALSHRKEMNNWCLECNNIFENYEEHKKSHDNKHDCPFCKQQICLRRFVEHLYTHAGIFKCKICEQIFEDSALLEKHKQTHAMEKPYVCPHCSKPFVRLGSLITHIVTHSPFLCDICKKHYKTKEELQNHVCDEEIFIKVEDTSDSESKPVLSIGENILVEFDDIEKLNFCQECNRRVKNLSEHVDKYHTIVSCDLCSKTFSNSYNLEVHTRRHKSELGYKCIHCDKTLSTRSHLKEHETTHTNEKLHRALCTICGKRFANRHTLELHMKQHTGKPEICKLCNKRFSRKADLRLHLDKHKGEKPHLCSNCGKAFAQKSHLTQHMLGHSEERPFECPHCEKSFKKHSLLKDHLKLHQENKSFKCTYCSYMCHRKYRLRDHIMKKHSDSPENTEELNTE